MTGQPSSHPSSSAMFDLQDRMRLVQEVVKTRLDQRRQSMKARYDKSVSRQAEFQVGDKSCLPPGGSACRFGCALSVATMSDDDILPIPVRLRRRA
ncbi:unnamed protein product [Clavelina lepadiformis]|uniref:Uncharacterized protein n=1 Tax=Clavelina lepadiformis TaxID=159417 RepID=A0ABP0G4K1_CLALP